MYTDKVIKILAKKEIEFNRKHLNIEMTMEEAVANQTKKLNRLKESDNYKY